MSRSNVVLPDPDGPTMAVVLPGSTERVTPRSTCCGPKLLTRPLTSSRPPDAGSWRSTRDVARVREDRLVDEVGLVDEVDEVDGDVGVIVRPLSSTAGRGGRSSEPRARP